MNRRGQVGAAFGVFLVGASVATPALHETKGLVYKISNDVLEVGREKDAGGGLTWVVDKSRPGEENLINNFDLGRQIAFAVRDGAEPNPTMVGDTYNGSPVELFRVDTDCSYTKTIPLMFYNTAQSGGIPSGPPREAYAQRVHSWVEFLPDASGSRATSRAFLVRHVWTNEWSDHPVPAEYGAKSSGQGVIPAHRLSASQADHVLAYSGDDPWTGGPLSPFTCGTTGDRVTRVSENWTMIAADENATPSNVDDDYGIANLTTAQSWILREAPTTWWDDPNFWSVDETSGVWGCFPQERFEMSMNKPVPPGEVGEGRLEAQRREGWAIFFVGDAGAARAFYAGFQPAIAGPYHDDFDDLSLWDLNTHPVHHPEVAGDRSLRLTGKMGFDQDVALPRRIWGDGVYRVDLGWNAGTLGRAGMVICKAGEPHFKINGDTVPRSGYSVMLKQPNQLYVREGIDTEHVFTLASSLQATNTLEVAKSSTALHVTVNGTAAATVALGVGGLRNWERGAISLVATGNADVTFDEFDVSVIGGDATPPGIAAGVTTSARPDGVELTWSNPADADWRWTRVVRKEGGAPAHWRDGFPVYEGMLERYVDIDFEEAGSAYYGLFTFDHAGNASAPVVVGPVSPGGPAMPPSAAFIASDFQGEAPLTVHFGDTSDFRPTSWSWSIDGATSTEQDPSHRFDKPGRYEVVLTATNAAGSDQASAVMDVGPVDVFQSESDFSGTVGPWFYEEVDATTGVATPMTWDGQGRWQGGTFAPPYLEASLSRPGLTRQSSRVWEVPASWSSGVTRSVRVTGNLRKANINSGNGVVGFLFHGSQLLETMSIDFDDSTGVDFEHIVEVLPGDRIECRLDSNGDTGADESRWDVQVEFYGEVNSPPAVTPDFNTVDLGGGRVLFKDVSPVTTSQVGYEYRWYFLGIPWITQHRPHGDVQFQYRANGTFDVTLEVKDVTTGVIGSVTKPVTIANTTVSSPQLSDFTVDVREPLVGQAVSFEDLSLWVPKSPGAPFAWSWDFGDGTTSNRRHPTHQYLAPGEYAVTLLFTDGFGVTHAVTKSNYIRVQ